jgi:peptidoglycan/LPS O-acetylase OafA/YrhL
LLTALSATLSGPKPITLAYVNSTLKVPLLMMATIVTAYGSYLLIERPARRGIREALMKRVRRAPEVALA